MLCVSLGEMEAADAARIAASHNLVEFRLDRIEPLSENDIRLLFSSQPNAIATCRPGARPDRAATLVQAIKSGARYVDVERESEPGFIAYIRNTAHKLDCKLIVSHHDYERTPARCELTDIREHCWQLGADICKIATYCRTEQEAIRLLTLLEQDADRTVAVGMGNRGIVTRIAALPLGSPFTFVSPDQHTSTAPGQLSVSQMRRILELMGYPIHDS